MTNRERFHKLMNGDPSLDQSPVTEWAPWWDKTLLCWQGEGMPPMEEQEIQAWFGLDPMKQFWFPHYDLKIPRMPDSHSGIGIIETESDYLRLRPYLMPEDAVDRMLEEIRQTIPGYESGNTIVWYTLNGFFWYPRELFGIESHLYSFYDQPELYHRICNDLADWHIRIIDRFASYLKADFMTFAEDMSYNLGPMLSEEMFREFLLPYYQRVIPEIKKYGTRVFVDSDGDISEAVPWFLEAGIEGVLPLERQAGVDLARLRQDYPGLLLLGGFDKMCLLRDKEAIAQEVKRLLPVIRSGKYLVGMDHQTPPGTTLENYRYYLSLLREAADQACKSNKTCKSNLL